MTTDNPPDARSSTCTTKTLRRSRWCQRPTVRRSRGLLGEVGVRFERWSAEAPLSADADSAAVLAAYAGSVKRVQADGGYGTVDVLRLAKGTPNTAPMRQKFLDEHVHTEDEVRFFVEGSGAFYLHLRGKVYQAICVRGDLISVPAGTPHWFDMGPDPEFIRDPLVQQPRGLGAGVLRNRHRGTLSKIRVIAAHAIVTDIEGTTSAISFVRDVLFPCMPTSTSTATSPRTPATALSPTHWRAAAIVAGEPDAGCSADLSAVLHAWIAEDRKASPPQDAAGAASWDEGYAQAGRADRATSIPTSRRCCEAWHAAGIELYVYSSGSIVAQKSALRAYVRGRPHAVVRRLLRYACRSGRSARSHRTPRSRPRPGSVRPKCCSSPMSRRNSTRRARPVCKPCACCARPTPRPGRRPRIRLTSTSRGSRRTSRRRSPARGPGTALRGERDRTSPGLNRRPSKWRACPRSPRARSLRRRAR